MNFSENINKALSEMGFVDLTEIQSKSIPLILDGNDVIGHSHTGTGKTAAFTIPILENLDFTSGDIQALIICPTRELAVQINTEIRKIAKYLTKLRTACVFGGEPIGRQITQLKRKPQIVIGTPGRTIDLINRRLLKFHQVNYMVLDEADEMLKMGFKEDIELILSSLTNPHQTSMFSATMPKEILHIAKTYMNTPEIVTVVSGETTNKDVRQYFYQVEQKNKVEAVFRLITVYKPKLAIVFCNTKRQVDEATEKLIDRGIVCDKIHGDLPQTTRLDVLRKFDRGLISVLVATDVAARGLDIDEVEAVINFDVPEKPDYYVHRIGRTGRIGRLGYSFTLVSKREVTRLQVIERVTKSKIKRRNIPTLDKVTSVKEEKVIDQILESIQSDTLSNELQLVEKLHTHEVDTDMVIAALIKLIHKEQDNNTKNDINENFDMTSTQKRNNRGGKTDRNSVRFHLNIGKNSNVSPKDLVRFISKKAKLRESEINDLSLHNDFTFFSANKKHKQALLKALKTGTLNGKKVSLQVAKKRK